MTCHFTPPTQPTFKQEYIPRISSPKIESNNQSIIERRQLSNWPRNCFRRGGRGIVGKVISTLIIPLGDNRPDRKTEIHFVHLRLVAMRLGCASGGGDRSPGGRVDCCTLFKPERNKLYRQGILVSVETKGEDFRRAPIASKRQSFVVVRASCVKILDKNNAIKRTKLTFETFPYSIEKQSETK